MADSEFAGHNQKADITRKDRLKFLMRKFRGEVSESDVGIADKTIELVLEIDRKLIALAHARSSPQRSDVEDCVQLAESALRRVLVTAP